MTKEANKTVLITGGAVRLGRAFALSLAEAGWDIALHYNRSAAPAQELAGRIRAMGRRAECIGADLAEETQVASIFPALAEKNFIPSCLINNAAIFVKDSLATLDAGQWRRQAGINLLAPLLLMRDFAAGYTGDQGNVINITDGLADWSMSPAFLSYTLSKRGLAHATQMLASELAPRIRVNAVAPGATLMNSHDTEEMFARLKAITPLKRLSAPEELCATVHYILSSPSLTGQVISLAGGLSAGV